MSQRQQDILAFITKHNDEKGYSPTIREIQLGVGLRSSSTVQGHIERLVKKGLLISQPGVTRTIKLVEQRENTLDVKVLVIENGEPHAIEWNGRIYVFDPMG
jgi:repressor LexA